MMTLTRHLSRSLRTFTTAAALAAATLAQAVPVSVSIGGLPPGLSPTLKVLRNTCGDGLTIVPNPSQPLTGSTLPVWERVPTLGGGFTFRQTLLTRYTATFDTPATPVGSASTSDRRCSLVGGGPDFFRFLIQVPGQDDSGRSTVIEGPVGEAPQSAPVTLNTTLGARTTSITPTLDALPRGMIHQLDLRGSTDIGRVQGERIDFLRPSTLLPGAFAKVASVFIRADGAGCVQAGKTTQCFGETALPTAGGVILRGAMRGPLFARDATRFQVELAQSFPVGTLKLRVAADATDLAAYFVDGAPEPIELLTWQPLDLTVTVQ